MSPLCLCFECWSEVPADGKECPLCHVSFAAPACPSCHSAVAHAPEPVTALNAPSWNTDWEQQCVHCGHEFQATVCLKTGHCGPFSVGPEESFAVRNGDRSGPFCAQTEISISGGNSIYMEYDSWDFQPTIQIQIRRSRPGNSGNVESRLGIEETIHLTVSECHAILRQLQGPLRILMQRLPSWRDTT